MDGVEKKLMEEKYCIICYEAIAENEAIEIPTESWGQDKFVHRNCFLSRFEELTTDATREKMLRYILAYERKNGGWDKGRDGITGWEATDVGVPPQKLKPFVNSGILGITFNSNKSTYYALAGSDLIKLFLESQAIISKVPVKQQLDLPDGLFSSIVGYDDVKSEMTYTLSSGKRCHYAMFGPPACGKTLFLMELGRISGTYPATGSTVTGPGLTDALLTYRPRVLLLDEVDKVKMDGISVLLSVMESGDVLETKYKKHGGQKLDLSVFAAGNTDRGLAPELLSRFDSKLYFKPYTREQFVDVCRRYLTRYEDTKEDIAEYIGRETWRQLDKDVRTARGVARKLRDATTAEVDRVVAFSRRYQKESPHQA